MAVHATPLARLHPLPQLRRPAGSRYAELTTGSRHVGQGQPVNLSPEHEQSIHKAMAVSGHIEPNRGQPVRGREPRKAGR